MSAPLSTSLSLLERVKRGQPDAWEALAELYTPLVYGWCRANGIADHDLPDVTQNVFLRVWRGIDRFERRRTGAFRRWLRIITRARCADYWRAAAKQASATGGSDAQRRLQELAASADSDCHTDSVSSDGDADESKSEHAQILRAALQLIRENEERGPWIAFWRVVIERDRAVDVAEDLGITVAAVYKAVARIHKRMHDEFDGLIDLSPRAG